MRCHGTRAKAEFPPLFWPYGDRAGENGFDWNRGIAVDLRVTERGIDDEGRIVADGREAGVGATGQGRIEDREFFTPFQTGGIAADADEITRTPECQDRAAILQADKTRPDAVAVKDLRLRPCLASVR